MKLYNTMSRRKEEFVPMDPAEVKIYACGPTVYNFIHIGNARAICVFDTLRRYLEYKGYGVRFVQNYTDVDDKIIRAAAEEGIPFTALAERYIREFETDARGLGLKPATVHPKASETMEEIIALIAEIIEKGHGYAADGDVYFRTRSFREYGKLSGMPIEELEAGARVDTDSRKEDPLDFALWKAAKPGEPSWPSPWGEGRPGWHIECTAMIRKFLGTTIDIHCGGQDLVFPHHENEIAQGECCTGQTYARYWVHNGFLSIDNKKMSKSLGNYFTAREVAEKYGYETIKLMMVQAHYRAPFNYTVEVLEAAQKSLERLYNCRALIDFAAGSALEAPAAGEEAVRAAMAAAKEKFIAAMEDDLNTADALTALYELTRELNIAFQAPKSAALVADAAALYDELCGVLGILYNRKKDAGGDAEVEALIAARQQARAARDFALADQIRDQLAGMGIVLKDTPQGVQWSRQAN